jgi:hypothetical protein
MERRFELRLEELLKDAVLDPRIPEGMLDRLEGLALPVLGAKHQKYGLQAGDDVA